MKKNYGFEFMSIFLAVISAFALNNWNDNRKAKTAETKILQEIFLGLNQDLLDIKDNQNGHVMGINAANYFRNMIAKKPVAVDSFIIYYFSLTRDYISVQNTSGFEVLKSKGFELIKNDSLRNKIISIYEYEYNILKKYEETYQEAQFHKNYFETINRILLPIMQFNSDKMLTGIQLPMQLSPIDEKIFLTYLLQIKNNRLFALNFYSQVIEKIELLKVELSNSIAKN